MKKIGESFDSFRKLRENDAYYIDKTLMLQQYLVDQFKGCVLFARPRRFGKTLTMTMFRDFLDITQDSKSIFAGLEIMNDADTVKRFMNQYPVVFLSLKEISGTDYQGVLEKFRLTAANLCKQAEHILENPSINYADRAIFESIMSQTANEANTIAVLDLLTRMLHACYHQLVFVIVDEYDVPMAKALGTPAYEQTRDMIEHMLSYVCKTNDHVKAVMLSGCLYTVKNSSYTGVNNVIPYTVLSPVFAASIGFTDDDVRQLLEDAGLSDRYETVKEWYDGYLFGREKMYCPWDVLRYVSSVLDGSYSPLMGPESYWLNTSETSQDIIHGFLGKTGGMMEDFEALLAGRTIDCIVKDHLPYHKIHDNGDNLWSALLETGYLTKAVSERMPLMPLRIPNREIQDVFRQEVWEFFKDRVSNVFVRDFINALWAGEAGHAENALNQILEATVSFLQEYHEYSYHLVLDGFFSGAGYVVRSETESGYGRSDLDIRDPARLRSMILELKHVQSEANLDSALQDAADQIVTKKYASADRYDGYTTILRYGMSFYKKRVRIVSVEA